MKESCLECGYDGLKLETQVAQLRAALEKVRAVTNGPSTQTWTREHILAVVDAALASAPAASPVAVRCCDCDGSVDAIQQARDLAVAEAVREACMKSSVGHAFTDTAIQKMKRLDLAAVIAGVK